MSPHMLALWCILVPVKLATKQIQKVFTTPAKKSPEFFLPISHVSFGLANGFLQPSFQYPK